MDGETYQLGIIKGHGPLYQFTANTDWPLELLAVNGISWYIDGMIEALKDLCQMRTLYNVEPVSVDISEGRVRIKARPSR